jgi:hypothetical protein
MVQAWVLGSGSDLAGNRNGRVENRKNEVFAKGAKPGSSPRAQAKGWQSARLLFFAVALLLLFVGFSLMRTYADEAAPATAAAGETTVMAGAGDTLWGIASEVKRHGLDTREAIHRIMVRNGLSSSAIASGEQLIIPANVLP